MGQKYCNALLFHKISHILSFYDNKIINCFFVFAWTAFASGIFMTSAYLSYQDKAYANPFISNGTGFADMLAGYGAYYDHTMLAILAIPVANYAAHVTQIVKVK